MSSALARHDAILREAIEANGGYVFKTVGDAFCAAFPTPHQALTAALQAQHTLHAEDWSSLFNSVHERIANSPQSSVLMVRMALHTGVTEERDGDYFGQPVNRVARLLAAGHGGQALLSEATCSLVRDTLPAATTLLDMGQHRLKDLARPEHIFQVLARGLLSEFPPLKTLDILPNNLPVQLTSFVGREKEMEEVKRLLSSARLLTLTGPGGTGKTRLSLQAAADVLEEFADGAWLVELAPLADPFLVAQTAASVLGVRETRGKPMLDTLADYLRDKELLIVLDNCEHMIEECARVADHLLRACPNLKVMVSSREPLGISGETAYRVPSLSLPDPRRQPALENMSQYEAVRLFVDRAVSALPHFTVTNQNAPAVAQICYRLDGIPLAIELAAARVRALPVEQLAARLDDRFRLLTGGSRTALPRQQTLRAAIDWSYDLLPEIERTLLKRLSVFAGGWVLEAAEQVCSGSGIDEYEALDGLVHLVDKSLVILDEASGEGREGRYRLLETIRQYARDKLLEAGEQEVEWVRDRHLQFYLKVSEEAAPKLYGPESVALMDRLEAEHDNLRAALEWSLSGDGPEGKTGRVEAGLRIAGALAIFWDVRGYWLEGKEWCTQLLALPEAAGQTSARARALISAGRAAYGVGDMAESAAFYKEALEISRDRGEKLLMTYALMGVGNAENQQANHREAVPYYEEALSISREVGDRQRIAAALANLASCLFDLGEHERVKALREEGLALLRELGDQDGMTIILIHMAEAEFTRGSYDTAETLAEQSLTLSQELGSARGIGSATFYLGQIAFARGEYERAHGRFKMGLIHAQMLGAKGGMVAHLLGLAQVAGGEGHYERAAKLHGALDTMSREVSFPVPTFRPAADRNKELARDQLGEEAWQEAYDGGQAMTLEQAVSYALEDNR